MLGVRISDAASEKRHDAAANHRRLQPQIAANESRFARSRSPQPPSFALTAVLKDPKLLIAAPRPCNQASRCSFYLLLHNSAFMCTSRYSSSSLTSYDSDVVLGRDLRTDTDGPPSRGLYTAR